MMENLLQNNGTRKKVDVVILVSDKIDLKQRQIKREKEGHLDDHLQVIRGNELSSDSGSGGSLILHHPPPSKLGEINNKHL